MDDTWKGIFDRNARKGLPLHRMSCWTERGYQERLHAFPKILERVENVKTVLDVGCGPGEYCRYLHDQGYQVTGADYAPAVIRLAKKRVPGVEFEVADGYDLPYEDGSFDLVISIGALQCLKDHRTFTKELARVARKAVILSTLRRHYRADPDEELAKTLEKDEWPARTYHPDDLQPLLEAEGYDVDVITSLDGEQFSDCFYLVARKH